MIPEAPSSSIFDSDIVIIGAGHAAGRAAEALRMLNFPGSITMVGEEPWAPYERPPLSKELLAGTATLDSLLMRSPEWYTENKITLKLGTRVETIERKAKTITLSDGTQIQYERLIIATGAQPRPLTIPGAQLPGVHYLRCIHDTLALRDSLQPETRLLIIGAGFIGLEVAAAGKQRGCEVTLAEAGPIPLGRVAAPQIGQFFADLHLSHGATLHVNTLISKIDKRNNELIALNDSNELWRGDVIVVGIGATPCTALAQDAGLHVDNGIVTNEFGRTSDEAIYAIGDVTSHFNPLYGRHVRLETWQNAQNQAIAVAKVLAGGTEPYSEVPWFWTDQHGVNFQSAGMPLSWDDTVLRGSFDNQKCTLLCIENDVLVGGATINNGRDMRFIRQLIERKAIIPRSVLGDPATRLDKLV